MGRFAIILLAVVLSSFGSLNKSDALFSGVVMYFPLLENGGRQVFDVTKLIGVETTIGTGCTWDMKKALLFDGTNNAQIALPKSTNLNLETSPMTLSMWIWRNTTGNRYLYDDLNAAATSTGATGQLFVSTLKFGWSWAAWAGITGSTNEVTAVWRHVVAVRSGTTGAWNAYIYLNGKLDASGSTAINPGTQAANGIPVIGGPGSYVGANNRWNGLIKHVIIWNRALSQTEVKDLYVKQKKDVENGR